MKKHFALILFAALLSTELMSQFAYFTRSTYPLDGTQDASDSLFIHQADIMSIVELSGGGSQINWQENFVNQSANIKEQIGDSAATAASFSFTLSTNSQMTSITVAGVAITSGVVPAAGSTNATASAIADSINAHTSSPNYSATVSTATVTITPTGVSTAVPNGRAVVVTSAGTVSPTNGILEGGFTRRNASTIYGAANTLIELDPTNTTAQTLLNAARIHTLENNGPAQFKYTGYPSDFYRVTESREEIQTKVNAVE